MKFSSHEIAKFDLREGKSLLFRMPQQQSRDYPTCSLQKGAVLVAGSQELAEEGLGFGVPLLKFGDTDVFPGSAVTSVNALPSGSSITVDYDLNFVKRLTRRGRKIESRTLYRLESYFGRLHRDYPWLRESGGRLFDNMRQIFGIKSVFEKSVSVGNIRVVYSVPQTGTPIHVAVDLSGVKRNGLTEVIISNEQGASHFVDYRDAEGSQLSGKRIGTWDEVIAEWASFIDSGNKIMSTVRQVNNAKLFRGREFTPGVLAWAGLNYVLSPDATVFDYDIELGIVE
jgi:hypothetical protein